MKYFRQIDKHHIDNVLSEYRSTGPVGYANSLVLARILKVKERISSDRELSEKLAKIKIYRDAIGISYHEILAHNTFSTLRQRLGPEGFVEIHGQLKKLRPGIERYYGLTKENRYHMETNNTYMGHDNVLIHVIEHDMVATLDIIYEHKKTGKWSDVLNV